ncbi:MAG: hypothetical protein QOD76_403, partial [Solirubrobacteraceae bacterium]|nr:hypothetical protein [Solirubrobacteraceae bacterium]
GIILFQVDPKLVDTKTTYSATTTQTS